MRTTRDSDDRREQLALGVAAIMTAIGLALVPSWANLLTDVCLQAAAFAALTIGLFVATRQFGVAGIAVERTWAALFLAAMPVVYVTHWLLEGGGGAWLAVELAGVPLYGAMAWAGLRRSPWWIALGIPAHGIAWDAWHWALAAPVVPTWYTIGCLLVDVGLGLYLVARVPAWNAAIPPASRVLAGTPSQARA